MPRITPVAGLSTETVPGHPQSPPHRPHPPVNSVSGAQIRTTMPRCYTPTMLARLGCWLIVAVLALSGQAPSAWAVAGTQSFPVASCCQGVCGCGDECPCVARQAPLPDRPELPPVGLDRESSRLAPAHEAPSVATLDVGRPSLGHAARGADDTGLSSSGRRTLLLKHVLRT